MVAKGPEQEGVLCSHGGVPNSFGQGCLLMTKMCFAVVIDDFWTETPSQMWYLKADYVKLNFFKNFHQKMM